MKILLATLTSLVVVLSADAFIPTASTSSTTNARSIAKPSALQGGAAGMDAYDAQMRKQAMTSLSSSSVAIRTDNYKSSPRWRKKTKQLATLGPASSSFEMIEKLFLAGADIFRLNFSHGEHAQKKELLDIIRQVEEKYDHPIAILGDL